MSNENLSRWHKALLEEDGDLLGMDGGNAAPKPPRPAVPKSLASRVRNASATLSYTLKPAPMKPIGAKAQKKKFESALSTSAELDQPIDLSLFQDLIEEETSYRATYKLTVESVCFTQQRPLRPDERPALPPIDMSNMSMNGAGDPAVSFQKPMTSVPSPPTTRHRNDHCQSA